MIAIIKPGFDLTEAERTRLKNHECFMGYTDVIILDKTANIYLSAGAEETLRRVKFFTL